MVVDLSSRDGQDLSRQSADTTAFFYITAAAGMLNGENAWCWYIMYNNNNNNKTGCVDSSYLPPPHHLHLLLKKVTLKVLENYPRQKKVSI